MKLALSDRRVPKAKGLWASNDYVIESCLGEETYKGTRTYGRVPGDMRDMTRRSRVSHARRRASLPPALSPLILVLAALPLATLPLNVGLVALPLIVVLAALALNVILVALPLIVALAALLLKEGLAALLLKEGLAALLLKIG